MAPEIATESSTANEGISATAGDAPARFWKDLQTIPNLLSLSRIVMILIAAGVYLNGYRVAGLIIGAIAGATDWLDGWLARKLNQSTELGAILDRLSDLVIETVALGCLLHYRLLPPVYFIIYMVREYMVTSARLFVAEKGRSIPSSFAGKIKSNLVMGSFVGFFGSHAGIFASSSSNELLYKIGYTMLVSGLVFSYISGTQYMLSFSRIYGEVK